jgi:hypothetical protein
MACKWFKVCPLRRLEKEGKISSNWRLEYCQTEKNWKNCRRFQMAETGKPHTDNMMPDGSFLKTELDTTLI